MRKNIARANAQVLGNSPTSSLLLSAAQTRLISEVHLHSRIVPRALDVLEKLINDEKTPATVRVSAISIALKMSGLAEKAAQKQSDNGKDERAMSLNELQAEIDKLNSELDARTIEGMRPTHTSSVSPSSAHLPSATQHLDIVE